MMAKEHFHSSIYQFWKVSVMLSFFLEGIGRVYSVICLKEYFQCYVTLCYFFHIDFLKRLTGT